MHFNIFCSFLTVILHRYWMWLKMTPRIMYNRVSKKFMECSHSYNNNSRVPFGCLNNSYLFLDPWEPFTMVDVFCASSKQNYPYLKLNCDLFFVWPVTIIYSIHQKKIFYISCVIWIWILWDCSSHAFLFYLWLHIFHSCSICSMG